MPLKSHLESYFEFAQFVLKHGKRYEAQPLPKEFSRMPYHDCFKTAANLAGVGRGTYVTGIGIWNYNPMPHAWIIDSNERVIDPTWDDPEKNEYYGIVIPTDMLREELHRCKRWELLRIDGRNNTDFMERWEKAKSPASISSHPLRA